MSIYPLKASSSLITSCNFDKQVNYFLRIRFETCNLNMFRPNAVHDTDRNHRYGSGGQTQYDEALLATSDRLRGMFIMRALRAGQFVLKVPETGEQYIPPPYSSGLNLRQIQNLRATAHYLESHPENHFMMTQNLRRGTSSPAQWPAGSRDSFHSTERYYSASQPEAPLDNLLYAQNYIEHQHPRQSRQRQRSATSSHRNDRRNAGPQSAESQEPTPTRVRHNSRDNSPTGPSTVPEQTKSKSSAPALTPRPLPTSNANSVSSRFQTTILTPSSPHPLSFTTGPPTNATIINNNDNNLTLPPPPRNRRRNAYHRIPCPARQSAHPRNACREEC